MMKTESLPMMFSRISAFAKASRFAAVLGLGALVLGAAAPAFVPAVAQAQGAGNAAAAQQIADHFSSLRTLTGEFVQFGPKGEQTGGTFYLERPGKIRFNYDKSPIRVISDGNQVVINNRKLDTWDMYALGTTPLKMLLADRIDLGGGRLQSVKQDPDMTTLVVADKTAFGNSKITMMFEPKTMDLKQWTITDAQGLDTTIMVFNVRSGVRFTDDMFKIDYQRIAMKRKGQ
ncbi:outer membrane lipoprotein carrier protein LolA [Ochrobactrum sp. MYb15]|uniref:Outer membrane lipoprotein carrier protein LolA n=2 Tax=Brucella pituitosa TaxID=571256 RepID=A0A643F279_9HYPH|nr:outer membrane lipoprotein carrier protein LolA [Brucella pituitosa]PQZ48825.1 outer membrane lipoprotein carrier protein LolA [Ochrobactrum sp. MYb19]PRA57970.1 outer membrane lipoprotein carrier protein LolA [Ochrobactrum sp. MYb68]PRA67358.1 outer membrane lipoprotein carrier protein LolA [Ochrobactrum sp. MYb18]PRA77683.1 outer membrane lipoprotein carrier protein LolA [Brucella thiophenivorans]PRA88614.1 outer membrane lipoprotein carrier protein LolA [Ochrobactrum sp. MYb29]PRA92367.